MVLSNYSFFQYCDSNIGFSFLLHIKLLLFQQQMLSLSISLLNFLYRSCRLTSFLYCIPYSYRYPNYCASNRCSSLMILMAIAKSKRNLFSFASKSEKDRQLEKSLNFRDSNQELSKELIPKIKQRKYRSITLQGAIEKSTILTKLIVR